MAAGSGMSGVWAGESVAGAESSAEGRSAKIASTVSWASFLLVPITPEGPRLIQPTTYSPGKGGAGGGVEDAAGVVGDGGGALVEGDAGKGDAAVADRAKDEAGGDRLVLVGGLGAKTAVGCGGEPVADERDGGEMTGGAGCERGGREQEAQDDALGPAGRRSRGVGAQKLDVASGGGGEIGVGVGDGKGRVELIGVDDDVGVGKVGELSQLGVGEGRLGGAATTGYDDFGDGGVSEDVEGVIGGVGGGELGGGEDEHAGDVEGDVAVADDDGAGGSEEVGLEVGVIGMAVVPADELGGGVRSGEVFAGDAEGAVGGRAGRIDDRVVVGEELVA